jgi:hypothetical protein
MVNSIKSVSRENERGNFIRAAYLKLAEFKIGTTTAQQFSILTDLSARVRFAARRKLGQFMFF